MPQQPTMRQLKVALEFHFKGTKPFRISKFTNLSISTVLELIHYHKEECQRQAEIDEAEGTVVGISVKTVAGLCIMRSIDRIISKFAKEEVATIGFNTRRSSNSSLRKNKNEPSNIIAERFISNWENTGYSRCNGCGSKVHKPCIKCKTELSMEKNKQLVRDYRIQELKAQKEREKIRRELGIPEET